MVRCVVTSESVWSLRFSKESAEGDSCWEILSTLTTTLGRSRTGSRDVHEETSTRRTGNDVAIIVVAPSANPQMAGRTPKSAKDITVSADIIIVISGSNLR